MKTTLPILWILLLPALILAQPNNAYLNDVAMPAPNAASLGKYGDIPVSQFTGLPNISVPITTVIDGDLSLPVSLNYHASGLPVGEPASWVGAGWSLSAGGMITRTVLGLPDEIGYYYAADQIDGSTVSIQGVGQSTLDGEADLFSFNVAGYTGKFFFDENSNIQIANREDVKVVVHVENSRFVRFILTTPKGVKYVFGNRIGQSDNTGVEKTHFETSGSSLPENTPLIQDVMTSWKLVEVISADAKNRITLNYTEELYSHKVLSSCSYTQSYTTTNGGIAYSSLDCGGFTKTLLGHNTSYNIMNVFGRRLTSISSPVDTVRFLVQASLRNDLDAFHSPFFPLQKDEFSAYALDRIEHQQGDFCQSWQFRTSYFSDPRGGDSEFYRLKLDSLQLRSCSGTEELPPYTFSYLSPENPDQTLFFPFALSKAVDHWGYYNGEETNQANRVNIPPSSAAVNLSGELQYFTYGSSNRDPDSTKMIYGALEEMTFPTGGATFFSYSPHDCMDTKSGVEELFSITNCDSVNTNCCGTPDQAQLFTFQAEQLDYARFSLDMLLYEGQLPIEYSCIDDPALNHGVSITVIEHSSGDTIGVIGFNSQPPLSGNQSIDSTIQMLEVFDTLQAGISYRFVLSTENAKGDFRLYADYPHSVSYQRIVGGLRVRQIISSPSGKKEDPANIVTHYAYQEEGRSSGILYQRPLYAVNSTGTSEWFVQFSSSALVPLGDFNGVVVGYKQVTERIGQQQGKSVYNFKFEIPNSGPPDFPATPVPIAVLNGQLDTLTTFHEQEQIVQQSSYQHTGIGYQSFPATSGLRLIRTKVIPYSPAGNTPDQVAYTFYQNRSGRYLVGSRTDVLDGQQTTRNYLYTSSHNQPLKETLINSDAKVYTTEYLYPTEALTLAGSIEEAVIDTLIARHMLHEVLQATNKVDHVPVGGHRTTWSFYDAAGMPDTAYAGTPPYPHIFERLERTWDETDQISPPDVWSIEATVAQRDSITGRPAQMNFRGWDAPEYYSWNVKNKQIAQRTFQQFNWQYAYHPNTRLVSRITNIDSQFVDYQYDSIMRLQQSSTRNGKVVTSYDYHYRTSADTNNYVTTTLQLDAVAGSAYTGETTVQYVDGLGRPIQTVVQAHSPNQQDVVTATQYDAYGRPFKQYEPFESSFSDGSRVAVPTGTPFTLTTFEASPLNRKLSVTPPEWNTTTYDYGSNPSSLTIAGVTYPGGSLKMETITDPNGHHSITYTDRRGRQVRTVRRKDDGSAETETDYKYDPKDRVRKIVPPGSTTSDLGLNYEYLYDGRDRIIQKKIPDQGWIDYVYDERDLPTAMRDARMRTDGRWLHTHYDGYGRATATGFINQGGMIDGGIIYSLSDSLSRTWYDGQGLNVTDPIYTGKVSRTRSRILGSTDFLETRTYYDAYGRISETRSNHIGRLSDTQAGVFTYSYDFADNITHTYRDHRRPDGTLLPLHDRITYDHAGRQIDHYLTIDGQQEHLSRQAYTIKDELKEKNLGGTAALQSLDYAYLSNGFLTGINNTQQLAGNVPLSGDGDWFRMGIYYDQLPDGFTALAAPQYNGNIAGLTWQTGTGAEVGYGYAYDYLDRLKLAEPHEMDENDTFVSTNAHMAQYSYDDRGNITELKRTNQESTSIDFLRYTYSNGTNRLESIRDLATGDASQGFDTGTAPNDATYGYDGNGNLSHDPFKNLDIAYNHLNLPDTIIQPGSNNRIVYHYDAEGNKLRKEVFNDSIILTGPFTENQYQARFITTNGQPTSLDSTLLVAQDSIVFKPGFHAKSGLRLTAKTDSTIVPVNSTDYIGGIEYRNDDIQAIYHPEGRAVPSGSNWRHEYVIIDHLGNTRLRFSDLDSSGTIDSTELLSTHDYYPFGLEWQDGGYKYAYNGKEIDRELGLNWHHYGKRMYDAVLGRFTGVDPISDQFPWVSMFNYAENYPTGAIDLHGLQKLVTTVYEVQREIQKNGNSKFNIRQLGPSGMTSSGGDWKGVKHNNVIFYEGKQYSSLNKIPGWREYRERKIEKARRIGKNIGVVGGGILTIAAIPATGGGSLSTLGALLEGFAFTSGAYAISSGAARLTLDLAERQDLADKVPGGLLNATVGLVIKSQVENEEVSTRINATLSVVEGVATFNFDPTNSVQSADNLLNLINNAENIEVIIEQLKNSKNNSNSESKNNEKY